MKDQNSKDIAILTFNDVIACCHDDAAGGGCLYLSQDKLTALLQEKLSSAIVTVYDVKDIDDAGKHIADALLKKGGKMLSQKEYSTESDHADRL